VALIYDARLAYDLKVMTGVAAYLQERTDYSVYIEENALKDQRLPDVRSWKGDGIIADFDDPVIARAVVHSRLPVVGFGGGYGWYLPKLRIPYFFPNNPAVSRLAAAHLLDRGLRHFAYCGYAQTPINGWSKEREKAFAETICKAGYSCAIYRGRHKTTREWASVQTALGSWLQSLPKPLGVMAANDNRARQVLETCRAFNLRVPEEIAVIGVDNDELLCQLSSPLLTSIEQGAKRIGYEAAALLDEMIRGKKPAELHFVTEPVGVVTRKSTDILAIEDPKVAQAMAFISDHAVDGIKVRDVVNAVAISPSGLEHRFKAVLGYTLRASIRRVQLERARTLITDTNLPLKQVAANTGFKSVQHLTTLFGRAFLHPPAEYRKLIMVKRPPAEISIAPTLPASSSNLAAVRIERKDRAIRSGN
jgi:LacI family transcriptional regulator